MKYNSYISRDFVTSFHIRTSLFKNRIYVARFIMLHLIFYLKPNTELLIIYIYTFFKLLKIRSKKRHRSRVRITFDQACFFGNKMKKNNNIRLFNKQQTGSLRRGRRAT